MEENSATATTQITYKKTSCYFCNEWLDNESFKSHIHSCGQRLERCPNNCLSFIQRRRMDDHLRECRILSPETISSACDDGAVSSLEMNGKRCAESITRFGANDTEIESKLLDIEQNIIALRNALNEEIRQRHRLITDVGEIRKQNLVSDEWAAEVSQFMERVKEKIDDEATARVSDVKSCHDEINRIERQYQEVKEWRRELRLLLDFIENELQFRDGIQQNLDLLLDDQRLKASQIEYLERDLNRLKQKQTEKSPKEEAITGNEVSRIRRPVATAETELLINEIRSKIPLYSVENIMASKLANLTLEVKQMEHIVHETEEKCDKLEKLVLESKRMAAETRQELHDLQIHLKMQKKMLAIHNCKGHLIWRIDNFATKMKGAKEDDFVLKSPMFCNRQYGYTLRLDVSLNGFGTWKGRNILACLTVVSGEWDTLLPWPCKLEADIVLRDQPAELKEAKNISKTILVKKRTASYEENQYIFIPHKTLATHNYLRKDAIFFEVKVLRSQN